MLVAGCQCNSAAQIDLLAELGLPRPAAAAAAAAAGGAAGGGGLLGRLAAKSGVGTLPLPPTVGAVVTDGGGDGAAVVGAVIAGQPAPETGFTLW